MAKKICLCKSLSYTFVTCKIAGILPVRWFHKNGKCHYEPSRIWQFYSFLHCLAAMFHLTVIYEEIARPFQQDRKLLLSYVSALTQNICVMYKIIFILLNIYKSKQFARMLNNCVELRKDNLLCDVSLAMLRKLHIAFFTFLMILNVLFYASVFIINLSDAYDTNWSVKRLLEPLNQHGSLLIYSYFGLMFNVFSTMLGCYEKKVAASLHYERVHPLKEMEENKNYRNLVVVKIEVCSGTHAPYSSLHGEELIEYIKSIYDKIKDNLYLANQCYNPQILIQFLVELINLVFNYFAVIIYFFFKESTPETKTLNFYNWVFAVVHTFGLFAFLISANQIETSLKRLVFILLEYSSRVSGAELDQQIRMFVQKLQNQQPLMASGVFVINKKIIVPMCANVLMYVLVAIQFDFPKAETSVFNITTPNTFL